MNSEVPSGGGYPSSDGFSGGYPPQGGFPDAGFPSSGGGNEFADTGF